MADPWALLSLGPRTRMSQAWRASCSWFVRKHGLHGWRSGYHLFGKDDPFQRRSPTALKIVYCVSYSGILVVDWLLGPCCNPISNGNCEEPDRLPQAGKSWLGLPDQPVKVSHKSLRGATLSLFEEEVISSNSPCEGSALLPPPWPSWPTHLEKPWRYWQTGAGRKTSLATSEPPTKRLGLQCIRTLAKQQEQPLWSWPPFSVSFGVSFSCLFWKATPPGVGLEKPGAKVERWSERPL